MLERNADPGRTGYGQIGSVESQSERGTPSIRFGYRGGGGPLTGTSSPAPTPMSGAGREEKPCPEHQQSVCWWYRKYAPGDMVLEQLEREARDARKGLWADPHPVPPWAWRKRKKQTDDISWHWPFAFSLRHSQRDANRAPKSIRLGVADVTSSMGDKAAPSCAEARVLKLTSDTGLHDGRCSNQATA